MTKKPELEVTTSMPERTNVREPDASGTVLSIRQVKKRYAVSGRELRRGLKNGSIQGAHRVPGPKGEQWRIPVASLEVLGFPRIEPEAPPIKVEPQESATVRSLLEKLDRLLDVQAQLTAGRDAVVVQHQEAQIELARTQERLTIAQTLLNDERERREAAEAKTLLEDERLQHEVAKAKALLDEEREQREAAEAQAQLDQERYHRDLAKAQSLLDEEREQREAAEAQAQLDQEREQREAAEAQAQLDQERQGLEAAEAMEARSKWPWWKRMLLWKLKDNTQV